MVGMKTWIAWCFAAAIASCLFGAEKEGSARLPPEFKFDNLVRVTGRPTRLKPSVQTLCLPPVAKFDHGNLVPQVAAVAHIYASPDAIEVMIKRDSTSFPVGSVILKQKLDATNTQTVVLYTGMLKREKGYSPDCGDWEFFTLSGDARIVTSRGRLESCMACHKEYSRSDFVTKEYPIER